MTPLEELQAARAQLATTLDANTLAFAEELAAVWRKLDRALVSIVRDAAQAAPSALIKAARAARLRDAIESAMRQAGWDALIVRGTGVALDTVVLDVNLLRQLSEIAAFAPADQVKIEALRALAGTDVLQEGEAVAHALWKATVQGVFGSRPADAILQDLGDLLGVAAPQVRTLYDTSITVFAREAESLGVSADPERPFVYTGPNDSKVRPFCRQHLGKVYTRTAIDAMDNGQLPNVYLTCGGYNCRHGWTAVSKFSDLARLAGTGERVPAFSRGIVDGGAKAA